MQHVLDPPDHVRAREQAAGLVHVVGPPGRRVRHIDDDALASERVAHGLELRAEYRVVHVAVPSGGFAHTEETARGLIHPPLG